MRGMGFGIVLLALAFGVLGIVLRILDAIGGP